MVEPLKVLIYRDSESALHEWCALCLDYVVAAWDLDPSEALLKLCDIIEVEESIRRDGMQVQFPDGVHNIRPEQIAAPDAVPDDVVEAFESSTEFDVKSDLNSCSLRGLKVRKTEKQITLFPADKK